MIDRKKVYNTLLYPPIWLILLLTLFSTVALIAVFVKGQDTSPVAYGIYVVAFYTLSVVTLVCIKVFPGYYRKLKQRIYNNKFGNQYMTDAAYRTHFSLYMSLGVNLLYVAMNIVSIYLYRSAWFAILAGYYIILAVMRFLLLRFFNRTEIGKERILEFKHARLCGLILMAINLTLSGAVLMMLYQDKGYEYHGILIYVMAAYTFYITAHAIINIIKYRKYNSPVLSTAKTISLSAALVSVLSLETAMLSQFGVETSPLFRRIMIAATGAGVSIIVVSMSVYMIIRATVAIKNHRSTLQNK